MTSYILQNLVAINLTDVSRFENVVSKLKVLSKSFPKMYYLSIAISIY